MGIKTWITRWQEPAVWLPGIALLALLALFVLGALPQSPATDSLAWLFDLPIVTCYALAALALTFLSRRRFRRKLCDSEQQTLWHMTVNHQHGAVIVYIMDAFVWLGSLALLLLFFSQAVVR